MAFEKKSMVVLLMIMMMCLSDICMGNVYKVGDSSGWTDNGKVDYKAWSSSKTFHVGDTIVFEYDNRFSNVVRVTHRDYNACSNLHAYFSFNSGNDSFTIPQTGHYYFISGLPGHCQSGQRVDIRVPKETPASAPVPAHAPVPAQAPPVPPHADAPVPAHAPAPAHVPVASAPAPAPEFSKAPEGMSPSLSPPSPKKKSGAVSISGMGMAFVMAIAVSIYGFGNY